MRQARRAAGGSGRAAAPDASSRPGAVARDARRLRRTIAGWIAAPSEGVSLTLSPDAGEDGHGALRMDYDFRGHGGWAAARKDFPRALPENWAIRLRLRGEGPPQTLEFKLLDPSGKNVWWSVRRDFAFPSDWTTLTIRKRQVTFAWGPAGGGVLTDLGAIEITVTAASGGRGRVWIDELALDILPPPGAPPAPLGEWRSAPGSGEEQTVRLDLGGRREIGGLSLFWDAADYARLYDVEVSDDGTRWRLARSIAGGRGGRAWIFLPETDAAFVRLRLHESAPRPGLRAPGPARRAARDRGLAHEVPRSRREGRAAGPLAALARRRADLLDARRCRRRQRERPSLRGRRARDGPRRLLGRAVPARRTAGSSAGPRPIAIEQSLEEGDLPIPSVRRTYDGGSRARGHGLRRRTGRRPPRCTPAIASRTRARRAVTATLYLALRPVQVNPPWQFLSTQGGAAPIRRVRWDAVARRSSSRTRHPVVRVDTADRLRRLELRPRARSSRGSPRATCRNRPTPRIPTGSLRPLWRSTSRFLREARATSSSPCRFRPATSDAVAPSLLRRGPRPPPPATGGRSSRGSRSPCRPRPSRSRARRARTWPGS